MTKSINHEAEVMACMLTFGLWIPVYLWKLATARTAPAPRVERRAMHSGSFFTGFRCARRNGRYELRLRGAVLPVTPARLERAYSLAEGESWKADPAVVREILDGTLKDIEAEAGNHDLILWQRKKLREALFVANQMLRRRNLPAA